MNHLEIAAMRHAVAAHMDGLTDHFAEYLTTEQAISFVYRAEGRDASDLTVEVVITKASQTLLRQLSARVDAGLPFGYRGHAATDDDLLIEWVEIAAPGIEYTWYAA